MTSQRTEIFEQEKAAHQPAPSDLIDRLVQFDGPPEQFLVNLLAVQSYLAGAAGAAVLRILPQRPPEVLAMHPPAVAGSTSPVWLSVAVEQAPGFQREGRTAIKPLHESNDLYGAPARRNLVMVPIRGQGAVRGMAAFLIETNDPGVLALARERVELTVSLLSLYEMRLTLASRQSDLQRLGLATETLAAVNRQRRFHGAALAVCNETASRWKCERVSLGFLKGRSVRVKAISHTEKFSRKMKLVQDIESAMEECIDQDVEVVFPPPPDSTFIAQVTGELARHHGPSAIVSLPLRKDGKCQAVLTVERPADKPMALAEVEALRLACDLCSPGLLSLQEQDRWFGARMAASGRKLAAAAVGTKHTWVKLLIIGLLGAGLYICLAKGDYRAEAPIVVEAIQRHIIPSPYDGFLETAPVLPGTAVEANATVLATMDSRELKLQLLAALAEKIGYEKQAGTARRDGKTSDEQAAMANADKSAANARLLEFRIRQARIVSPVTGIVLVGDLSKKLGSPVKAGEVLFEVAPLESMRVDVLVGEDQITDVKVGQTGEFATASYPGRKIKFKVERINPVAEQVKQENVFRVRGQLDKAEPTMLPGMEGMAKIDIDKSHSYAWIWTRRLVNWVQMKLWI